MGEDLMAAPEAQDGFSDTRQESGWKGIEEKSDRHERRPDRQLHLHHLRFGLQKDCIRDGAMFHQLLDIGSGALEELTRPGVEKLLNIIRYRTDRMCPVSTNRRPGIRRSQHGIFLEAARHQALGSSFPKGR